MTTGLMLVLITLVFFETGNSLFQTRKGPKSGGEGGQAKESKIDFFKNPQKPTLVSKLYIELDRKFHEKILENIDSGIKREPPFFIICSSIFL